MNTELLFQTVHFVNQLSVYATVTGWCYQFGLTDEEKERLSIPLDNWVLPMVKTARSRNVGISSEPDTGKQDTRKHELPSIGQEDTDDTIR